MTDHDDELIERLGAADPVDPHSLPSADDPAARSLLETIVTNHAEEPKILDLPDVPGLDRYSGKRRNPLLLLGAAAAVVLLVAGFLVFAPDNTDPALATVRQAAEATANADSGRVSTTFSLEGTDGVDSAEVAGTLNAEFSGSDISFSIAVDESTSAFLPGNEARLVDETFYFNDGSQWYAVETGGFVGSTLVDFVDPRSVLTTVQELLDTEEIGSADIDGVATTQYRSVVDLGDESLSEAGWLALEGADIDAEGQVVVDLYIDDDGLLRRLDVTGDVQEPDGGAGEATFTVSTSFTDIGDDITIEAPADAQSVDQFGDRDTED